MVCSYQTHIRNVKGLEKIVSYLCLRNEIRNLYSEKPFVRQPNESGTERSIHKFDKTFFESGLDCLLSILGLHGSPISKPDALSKYYITDEEYRTICKNIRIVMEWLSPLSHCNFGSKPKIED